MNNEVPFQIEHLITNLLNQKENVYIRQNYRARLESIRDAIDKSLRKYDNELNTSNNRKKRA
jgi:metal-responsive CopG/Arc/MetJ family transcriptional regulator